VSNYQKVIDMVNQLAGKKDWSTQIYITITQDPLAGLLLDRIVWWSDKSSRDDGFFWKTAEEWESELCLSYAQVARLTKALKDMGLIETTRKRANGAPTIHYKPILPAIVSLIKSKFKKVEIQESRNSENSEMEIQESRKSEIQESQKSITAKTIKDSSKIPNGSSEPLQDDSQKWNNANKKVVGDKFLELTRLKKPTNKQTVGAWWGWLYEIFELSGKDATETCRIMTVVVDHMQSKHLSISSPKSLINLARSVVSGQSLNGSNGPSEQPRPSPQLSAPVDLEKLRKLQAGEL
jgi:hypothetical protein